jgi:hypothetical protein
MLAESRRKSMLQYVSEGASVADLDAAGYTLDEISILPNVNTKALNALASSKEYNRDRQGPSTQTTKTPTFSQEFDRDRQGIPQNNLESYSPTYRDYLRGGIEQGATALGVSEGNAKFLANRTAGSGGEMGFVDMLGVGAPLFIQEGSRQFERGYDTGSKTNMAMGALGVGVGAISAIPGAGLIAKGLTKGAEKVASKFLTREAEQAVPEVIQAIDAPVAREVTEAIPEVAPTPAIIRPDTQFRGNGSFSNNLESADVPFAYRVTGQTQIDDMIKSGMVRPNEGGYGKRGENTVHYGAMPEATPSTIANTPKADPNKGFTIVADKTKIAGKEGPATLDDLQHIWTIRNGEMVDILPEVRLKNLDYKAPEVAPLVDQTVAALGTAPKTPYKPTMFQTTEAGKIKLNPNSLMEFYSPTVETIRNVEFPAKGYKGSELLKFLRDKAPGVRKTEVDALGLKIDPQKRYTREEALAEVEGKSYKVYAEEVDDTIYKSSQRQDISDPEISFSTIKINATREGDTFMPSHGYTHYDPETIAHSRNSIREDAQGKRYLLVEEVQSDLVQAGSAKPRGALTRDEAYQEAISQSVKSFGKDPKKLILYKKDQKFYDSVFKTSSEDARLLALKTKGVDVPKEELDNLEKLRVETQTLSRNHNYDDELYSIFDDLGYGESRSIDRRMNAITKAPLTEDADAVRLALQSAMAKADESDATSIVIPNLQRIVTAQGRGARYGTENYDKYMKAGSGFQKTYVDGVDSFIAQLKKEYGDAIKIEQIELPYTNKTTYYSDAMSGRDVPLDNTALRIDFSGLKGVNLKSGQFAEGGVVEEEQMDRLMQEGGIAGSNVAREPVTGNEVPPGALPSEVRDDVSAQLSEGEYVVPADVVRFFGVKFFEDLRMQAKQGMSTMEANGRIGGAAVNDQGVPMGQEDDDLSPEEEQMLNEALGQAAPKTGMAYGGMVMGMAEGGDAPAPATTGFDRTKFKLSDYANTGMEVRQYYNPKTKETRMFQFINGVSLGAIPDGFVPYTAGMEEQPATSGADSNTSNNAAGGGGSGNTGGYGNGDGGPSGGGEGGSGTTGTGINYTNWAEKNRDAINADPYQFGLDALNDTTGKMASKGLGGLGLLSGNMLLAGAGLAVKTVSKIQNIAEANAALQIMDAKGLSGSEQYKELEKAIGTAVSDLPLAQQALVKTGLAGSGDGFSKAYLTLEETPKVPTQSAAVQPSNNKEVGSTGTTVAGPPSTPVGGGMPAATKTGSTNAAVGSADDKNDYNPPSNKDKNSGGGTGTATTPTKAQVSQYTSSNQTTPTTPTKAQVSQYTSSNQTKSTTTTKAPANAGSTRFEKGGLVTKTKKTTPKAKGLAGKQ